MYQMIKYYYLWHGKLLNVLAKQRIRTMISFLYAVSVSTALNFCSWIFSLKSGFLGSFCWLSKNLYRWNNAKTSESAKIRVSANLAFARKKFKFVISNFTKFHCKNSIVFSSVQCLWWYEQSPCTFSSFGLSHNIKNQNIYMQKE